MAKVDAALTGSDLGWHTKCTMNTLYMVIDTRTGTSSSSYSPFGSSSSDVKATGTSSEVALLRLQIDKKWIFIVMKSVSLIA